MHLGNQARKKLGLWFKASDERPQALAGIGKKADQAQLKLFKNGKPCGEVKLERTYQVVPPSWKKLEDGTRADYKLLQDAPPAEIRLAELLEDLQAIGITFSSKLESNAKKLEDMGKKAHQRRAESDEARSRRYAEAALESEVKALGSSEVGNRNDQLNRSSFALGQFVAAGVLSEAEVIRALQRRPYMPAWRWKRSGRLSHPAWKLERNIQGTFQQRMRPPARFGMIPKSTKSFSKRIL